MRLVIRSQRVDGGTAEREQGLGAEKTQFLKITPSLEQETVRGRMSGD